MHLNCVTFHLNIKEKPTNRAHWMVVHLIHSKLIIVMKNWDGVQSQWMDRGSTMIGIIVTNQYPMSLIEGMEENAMKVRISPTVHATTVYCIMFNGNGSLKIK